MKPLQLLLAVLAVATALFAASARADGIDQNRAGATAFNFPYNSPYW